MYFVLMLKEIFGERRAVWDAGSVPEIPDNEIITSGVSGVG